MLLIFVSLAFVSARLEAHSNHCLVNLADLGLEEEVETPTTLRRLELDPAEEDREVLADTQHSRTEAEQSIASIKARSLEIATRVRQLHLHYGVYQKFNSDELGAQIQRALELSPDSKALKDDLAELHRLRDEFIKINNPLVVHLATKYRDPSSSDFDELIQEGRLGLRIAMDNYDFSHASNSSLSHYMAVVSRRKIKEYLIHKSAQKRSARTISLHAPDSYGRAWSEFTNEPALVVGPESQMDITEFRELLEDFIRTRLKPFEAFLIREYWLAERDPSEVLKEVRKLNPKINNAKSIPVLVKQIFMRKFVPYLKTALGGREFELKAQVNSEVIREALRRR